MLCPSCGQDVAELKFCENCGAPLAASQNQPEKPAAQPEQPEVQPEQPAVQSEQPAPAGVPFGAQVEAPAEGMAGQPTAGQAAPGQPAAAGLGFGAAPEQQAPAGTGFNAPSEQPGLSSEPAGAIPGQQAAAQPWSSQPAQGGQQPSQADATAQMPQAGSMPPYGYDPRHTPPVSGQSDGGAKKKAPATALVLVIVGAVLCLLGITCLPGLICCAIGLILNAGYAKKGFDNKNKLPTLIVGIIGLVIGVLVSISCVTMGVALKTAYDAAIEQGIDPQYIDIKYENGEIVVSEKPHMSTSTGASSASTPTLSGNSASASSSSTSSPTASGYFDSKGNVTMPAVCELTGSELQQALASNKYEWFEANKVWSNSSESSLMLLTKDGAMSKQQIDGLAKGGSGSAAVYSVLSVGYSSPKDAIAAFVGNAEYEGFVGDGQFALVTNSAGQRYLVAATPTDGSHTVFAFTEKAVQDGTFNKLVGVNLDTDLDKVWAAISS